ncbi:MAG: hypothetical protein WBH94_09040, partial [Methanoculleus sp.]
PICYTDEEFAELVRSANPSILQAETHGTGRGPGSLCGFFACSAMISSNVPSGPFRSKISS